MSDVITLANQIAAEKENIRQAIEDRGVSIPVTTPLTDYAAKISSISTQNVPVNVYFKGDQVDTGTSVTLNATYGTIANNAFSYLPNLQTVDLNYVTVVGAGAFESDSSLSSLTATSLKYVGDYAFQNTALPSFSNSYVKYIGNHAFQNTPVATVSISDCVEIHDSAFEECDSLTSVSGNSLKHIGSRCFYNCPILTSVSASNVEYIGNQAFYRMGNGSYDTYSTTYNLSFPECVHVGRESFYNCKGLESFSATSLREVGDGAFNDCNNLTTFIATNVTSIGRDVFDNTNNISSLNVPNCVSIGQGNFYSNTHRLDTLTIANGCSIGDYCFRYGVSTINGKPGRIGHDVCSEAGGITYTIDLSEVIYIGCHSFRGDYGTINFTGGFLDLKNCTTFDSDGSGSFAGTSVTTNVTKLWIRGDVQFTTDVWMKDEWFGWFNRAECHIYTDAAERSSGWGNMLNNATWHFGATHEEFEEA